MPVPCEFLLYNRLIIFLFVSTYYMEGCNNGAWPSACFACVSTPWFWPEKKTKTLPDRLFFPDELFSIGMVRSEMVTHRESAQENAHYKSHVEKGTECEGHRREAHQGKRKEMETIGRGKSGGVGMERSRVQGQERDSGKSMGFGVRARATSCQVSCSAGCCNICTLVGGFPNGAASSWTCIQVPA